MDTKEILDNYFETLKQNRDWSSFLSDKLVFTNFALPIKKVEGKPEFLNETKNFYSMIKSLDVKDMIIDGENACVLTSYELQSPSGQIFKSDVAEIFTIKNNKIQSFDIYFDNTPFPK